MMQPKIPYQRPQRCPHCGAELQVMTHKIKWTGQVLRRTKPCTCEGAKKEAENRLEKDHQKAVKALSERCLTLCGSQVAPVYWMAEMRDYIVSKRNRDAVAAAYALTEKKSRFLLLIGEAGVGKTRLAYSTLTECLVNRMSVGVVRSSSLAQVYRDDDKRLWSWIRKAARVVLIDDLGKEELAGYLNEAFQAALFELVDAIYSDNHRALIVTSELNLDQILNRYKKNAKALRWRFKDMSRGGRPQRIYKAVRPEA